MNVRCRFQGCEMTWILKQLFLVSSGLLWYQRLAESNPCCLAAFKTSRGCLRLSTPFLLSLTPLQEDGAMTTQKDAAPAS